jgi:hypothetical protein
MVDYQKTEHAFKAANYSKYEHDGNYHSNQEEKRWYAKVRSPITGRYIQYKDLDVMYRINESKVKKVYPLVQVIQLVRVKTSDYREWIKSLQQWTGIDQLGNEIETTFTAPEVWDKPDFKREMIRDPRHPEKPPELTITGYNFQQEHAEPFTKEKVEELYSKANHNTLSLSIKRVSTNGQTLGHVNKISKYDDFVEKSFDDLWDYMEDITAPRYKRDRSYGNNLESSHIK